MEKLVSCLGLLVMMGAAWLLSSQKRHVMWRPIVGGLVLQFAFAYLTLRTPLGRELFAALGDIFTELLGFVDAGATFVFGVTLEGGQRSGQLLTSFAFGVLPSIIFFSSLMSILYHFNVMQRVVHLAALGMQKVLNISGAE